jgi:hypothetical protein
VRATSRRELHARILSRSGLVVVRAGALPPCGHGSSHECPWDATRVAPRDRTRFCKRHTSVVSEFLRTGTCIVFEAPFNVLNRWTRDKPMFHQCLDPLWDGTATELCSTTVLSVVSLTELAGRLRIEKLQTWIHGNGHTAWHTAVCLGPSCTIRSQLYDSWQTSRHTDSDELCGGGLLGKYWGF